MSHMFYKCDDLVNVNINFNTSKVEIGKNAFKKLPKEAVISINGVKGKKKVNL